MGAFQEKAGDLYTSPLEEGKEVASHRKQGRRGYPRVPRKGVGAVQLSLEMVKRKQKEREVTLGSLVRDGEDVS